MMYAISSAPKCQLIGVSRRPLRAAARYTSANSGRLEQTNVIACPASIPRARMARTSWFVRASSSAHVRSPAAEMMAISSGCVRAR
jgi:hypothetical protein